MWGKFRLETFHAKVLEFLSGLWYSSLWYSSRWFCHIHLSRVELFYWSKIPKRFSVQKQRHLTNLWNYQRSDKDLFKIKNIRNLLCPKSKSVRNFQGPPYPLKIFSGPSSSFFGENIPIYNLCSTSDVDRTSTTSDFGGNFSKEVLWNSIFSPWMLPN